MHEHGISSLLVNEGNQLRGIVTDRDLRNRVLAVGRDPAEPVTAIMTAAPLTLDASSPVLSGILAMAGRGIHHLPLTQGERVVGHGHDARPDEPADPPSAVPGGPAAETGVGGGARPRPASACPSCSS
jgi:hypothetical protein